MKLSFNSWVYCSFPTWLPVRSLEDVIDTLSAMGYDGIEIGAAAPHGYPDYLDAERRKAIADHLGSRGIEVSAICPALGGGPGFNPVSPDEQERRASINYITECIKLASDIGCETVIWLGGFRRYGQTYSEAWHFAVENLRECAEIANESGVRLAVEPTPQDSNMIEHAGDCLRIMSDADVDDSTAGVMLDTAHIFHRNDELKDAFRGAGDHLTYVHLTDVGRDAPGTHRNFSSIIEELRTMDYEGWLTMEVGFNRREEDPDEVARASLAHIRGILQHQLSR